MSGRNDATIPSTRRTRKSTGLSPGRKKTEKENITVDVASSLAGNGGRKKSRSKSIGPGGLDALKPGSGNRRVSLAAPARPPPRSILKPTMPLLPEIPSYKSKKPARNSPASSTIQGADKLPNLFHTDDAGLSGTKIAVRTEEEQQAAAREREERERAEMEKEINDRREARRKSLANRRVSFAAEATLHTFHEVEYMQDSTTSTDSTRRASSLAASQGQASDSRSGNTSQADDLVPSSPEQDTHDQRRRRSSGVSNLGFNQNDDTMASSIYSSDSEGTDVIETHEEIGSDSGSDSDADGVSMDLDVDEVTGTSVASAMSARSVVTNDSDDTLNTALRLASRRAETQNIDEEEEIIPSFGWAKKPAPKQPSPKENQENLGQEDTGGMDMDMDMDMDMTNAVGGIIKANDDPMDDAQGEEMSMDVTRALGGILPSRNTARNIQSASPEKQEEESLFDDAPMDLTVAVGGIQKDPPRNNNLFGADDDDNDEDEDMSMEFTAAVGSVLSGKRPDASKKAQGRRRTLAADDDEATMDITAMDMTVGVGRILSSNEDEENEEDATMGMDMTMAMGGIIKGPPSAKDRTEARLQMEREVDENDNVPALNSSAKQRLSAAISGINTSDSGSPGLSAFRGQGLRRTGEWRRSVTPGSSPVREITTPKSAKPTNTSTPNSQKPRTPLRRSPRRKSKSPAPASQSSLGVSTTPKSAPKKSQMSVFQQDPTTGVSTPRVILTPQKRRLSGVGADRPGLGSPKVAAIFDRRESIGDAADDFVPREPSRSVAFADPRVMEYEVDRERQLEADRENGRKVLEREVDGDEENTAASLKDMISSMTPKKNPLKGRKSLHVGSAKGLLGKRPAELDDEEEAEERDGIKRLKNHQSSPVKNIRLHAPPSKAETTGRVTRSSSRGLEDAASTPALSPKKTPTAASSPRGKGLFKDVDSNHPTSTLNFDESHVMTDAEAQAADNGEQIHLQDFLNMTNIRFMELTTTKRRHTQAPTSVADNSTSGEEDMSLERCVVAGACTVPMLELYQHSCRELKKYISEGRRIVREIETETLEENPPLFKEYMTATPEYKLFLDNQFKNVKSHARLLSKAMWYEWRMKLQDGLKEGLLKIEEGMAADEQLLHQEQELLDSILPKLVGKFASLELEHDNLQSAAQELAECDPDDLQAARSELTDLDSDIEAKAKKIEQLRQQLSETEAGIDELSEKKKECVAEIEEAEKIREQCRGWTSNEVSALKARVEAIEKQHGWAITGVVGTSLSMTYRREIELVFDVRAFKGLKPDNSRIDLSYIAANREQNPQPSTPEKEFFIQCMRDHVRGLVQAQTRMKNLLDMVSTAWQKANHVARNVHLLNTTYRTKVTKTSDSSISIRSWVLLVPLQTKVEVVFSLDGKSTPDGVEVTVTPQARVVYGEQFKEDKIVEFLTTKIGTRIITKEESGTFEPWVEVLVELQERLLGRGRK
ncbi:Spc7-domain-containing protein [Daldinia eschscholtzii]|nr:Spc7-domain-containing protein [Daldinia eschscholtzii]